VGVVALDRSVSHESFGGGNIDSGGETWQSGGNQRRCLERYVSKGKGVDQKGGKYVRNYSMEG